MPEATRSGITIKPIGQMMAAINRYGQQLFQAPNDTIRGIEPDTWYSPDQPVKPIAPEGTEPRAFQYWAGQNLLWTPRADAEYSAADLKQLALYPLARICIENVKDSICRVPWEIQLKPQEGETKKEAAKRAKGDQNILKLSRFFEYPDRFNNWTDWLRPLLEDMLVIDAPSILVRKTFNGDVVELPVISGDAIVRYIDQNGWTPMPPQPAYAQNWWGIPLVNMTTEQLIYKPRNIVRRNTVASQLYGMPPVEQLATELKVGIERLNFTLAYYTEGSIPGVLQVAPPGTSPEKIAEAMQWNNSELSGNLAARRKWQIIQGFKEEGKDEQIVFTKEPLLADLYDELHLRKVAFGIGTSPQRLLKAMNRASAQQVDEASEVEGTLPYVVWLKGLMDYIIVRVFRMPGYEWVGDPFREPDMEKQAKAVTTLVENMVLTPNQGRERIGEEPDSAPEADMLGVKTATGFVPLGLTTAQAGAEVGPDGKHKITQKPGEDGKDPKAGKEKPAGKETKDAKDELKPNGNGKGAEKLWAHCELHKTFNGLCDACKRAIVADFSKAVVFDAGNKTQKAIHPGRLHPRSILARQQLDKVLRSHFKKMDRKARRIIAKNLGLPHGHIQKAAGADDETTDEILKAIVAEWKLVAEEAQEPFTDATLVGAETGALQLDITDEDMLATINETASDWAADRSAELVGMRRSDSGRLVKNPDAKWAISDTTRDKLRETVAAIFREEEATLADVEQALIDAGIFSDERATMIARTEISRAQTQGNLETWKGSKLVEMVEWQLSADHDRDDECDDLADSGPYKVDEVPDLPAHPNCMCALVISEETAEEEE